MKKLLLFVFSIISLWLLAESPNPMSNMNNSALEDILSANLPDSLLSEVTGKPVIIYRAGHYGYSWSLVTRNDSCFKAFSGRVNYAGNQYINFPSQSNHVDSVLFSKNGGLLTWALDSMPTEQYNFSHNPSGLPQADISVINSDGAVTFHANNEITFDGQYSTALNNKYNKLCLVMWWLADPRIRQHIPESVIF